MADVKAAVLTSVLVGFGNLCKLLRLLGTILKMVWSFPVLACTKPFPDYFHNLLIHQPVWEMSRNATATHGLQKSRTAETRMTLMLACPAKQAPGDRMTATTSVL